MPSQLIHLELFQMDQIGLKVHYVRILFQTIRGQHITRVTVTASEAAIC